MKGNTIAQSHTAEGIILLNTKPDSIYWVKHKGRNVAVEFRHPNHWSASREKPEFSLCFAFIIYFIIYICYTVLFCLISGAGFSGCGCRQWDYIHCWGEIYGMLRAQHPLNTLQAEAVWLRWLISAITAQLDWPDILLSFIKRITHSMEALSRQLLLQQRLSILGLQDSVWGVAI